jgi:type II secretory pathway component GspD/PulD (secretin)
MIKPATILVLLFGLQSAWGGPAAAQGAGTEPAPVTLSVQNMDITEVLDMFSRTRGLNIVTTGEVSGNVTVDLHEVPFDQALQAVVCMAGFEVVKRGDIYFVRRPTGDDAATSVLNEVRTYQLNYADLDRTLPVLQQLLSPAGKISGYPPTRAVVAEDRPEVLQRIGEVVRSIDLPPRQVLIEARVLEVRLKNNSTFGIDWSLAFSKSGGKGQIDVQGLATPKESGAEGMFITWGKGDFMAALEAMEGVEDLNTLAAPRLLALDGKAAQIVIGGELGFPVVTTVENTVIQSVQFLQVGTQLKITPTITDDGMIRMQVHPELSDGVVQEGIPSKTTTEVTTEVLIKDGQTLFIGGLIRERNEQTRKGIPLLMDLPFVGRLFSRTTITKEKSELVTLITPKVVHPGESADPGTDRFRDAIPPAPGRK